MPLPIPRWVISSPNHMSRIVPEVSVTMITKIGKNEKSSTIGVPALAPKERNRNT